MVFPRFGRRRKVVALGTANALVYRSARRFSGASPRLPQLKGEVEGSARSNRSHRTSHYRMLAIQALCEMVTRALGPLAPTLLNDVKPRFCSSPAPPTPPDIPPFTNQNTRSNINLSRVLTRRPCQPTSSERNGGQLRGIEVPSPRIKARYD